MSTIMNQSTAKQPVDVELEFRRWRETVVGCEGTVSILVQVPRMVGRPTLPDSWLAVLRVSEGASVRFLADEPDLYDE